MEDCAAMGGEEEPPRRNGGIATQRLALAVTEVPPERLRAMAGRRGGRGVGRHKEGEQLDSVRAGGVRG